VKSENLDLFNSALWNKGDLLVGSTVAECVEATNNLKNWFKHVIYLRVKKSGKRRKYTKNKRKRLKSLEKKENK
jgi:hypothetical protein